MVHMIIERDLVCEGSPSQGFDALHTWLGVELEELRLAPDAHWQFIRTLMTDCIVEAQSFILFGIYTLFEVSPVSLTVLRTCL